MSRLPRGGEVGGETLHPVAQDGVPVRHDQRAGAGRGDLTGRGEDVAQVHAAGQRPHGGVLDDRAVHDRVAVGNADLDDVDAGLDEDLHRPDRALDGGETHREVADEGRTVVGAALLDDGADAHCSTPMALTPPSSSGRRVAPSSSMRPNHSAAVWTSLSPRPERLTSRTASGRARARPSSHPRGRARSRSPAGCPRCATAAKVLPSPRRR